ncbi:hypothetical protein [Streptomyces sp. NPDC048603]|uniref:hypothetical protein n=1 Tax=Streptomyces sp. NPDC048603 TaxID=3365577 RepID=UPI0037182C90
MGHDLIPRVVSAAAIDWIKFDALLARDGSVEPVDKALYAAIASFADQGTRETVDGPDADDIPTRKVLARCIGRSVDTVDRSTKRLEDKGLLEVERRPDPSNPRVNIPSLYRLLDHERWDERAAARAEKRQAEREARAARKAKQHASNPKGGGRMGAATPEEGVAAPVRPGWPHGCGQGGRTGAAVPSSLKESLSQEGGALDAAPVEGGAVVTERETLAAPENHGVVPAQRTAAEEADQVVSAYRQALRRPITSKALGTIRSAAAELLTDGFPAWWLCDRVQEMAPRGWTDLHKHADRSTAPTERSAAAVEWCGDCGQHDRKRYNDQYEYVDCWTCSPIALAGVGQ